MRRREFALAGGLLVAGCGGGSPGVAEPPPPDPDPGPGPGPTTRTPYRYGTWRLHQPEVSWRTMQPQQGGYLGTGSDRGAMQLDWSRFDARLDEAAAAGISVIFSAWLTPAWASRPQDQVGGSNTVPGPWEVAGESAVPEKPQYVYDFVRRVLERANAQRRRIKFLETLNEPELFDAAQLAAYRAANRRPFFTGTPAQAVAYAAAGWRAAQDFNATVDADRRVTVLAPAQYDVDRLRLFLTARDAASGLAGHQTFDWLNLHPYTTTPNKPLGGEDLWTAGGSRIGIATGQRLLASLGLPPRPVAVTEWGLNTQPGDAQVQAFATWSAAERRTYVSRLLAMAALSGLPLFTIFSNGRLAGDYDHDTEGVIAALSDVHDALAGRTLVAGGWWPDGRVTVTRDDGHTFSW